MIPQRIYLKGFMSYRDEQTLLFDKAPLWVLAGPNGAGKSTVFDAITFALYGRHRAGAQRANELINHDSDNLVVEFDFVIDETTYRARRTVSKKNNKVIRDACIITTDKNGKEKVKPIEETASEEGFKNWVNETIGLNYETFTSSILLLQGQSEKLLTAEPKDRYKILTELIDLSLYQKLAQKADDKKKEWDQNSSVLKRQLEAIPEVSDEKIKSLEKKVLQIEKDYSKTTQLIEKWTELLSDAKNWEILQKHLEDSKQELTEANELLAEAPKIKQGWERYKELEQIIPTFKQLKEKQLRIIEQETKLKKLSLIISTNTEQLAEREKEKSTTQSHFEAYQKALEKLEKSETALIRQIDKAASLIDKLKSIEKLKQQLDEVSLQLTNTPKNLNELIEQVSSNLNELREKEQALPWLKQILSTHEALQQIPNNKKLVNDKLSQLEIDLANSDKVIKNLKDKIKALDLEENELNHNVTSQNTLYKQLQKRTDDFAKVSNKATCDLCGQQITEEHKRNEEFRLKTEIQKLIDSLSSSKIKLEELKQQKLSISQQEEALQIEYKKILQIKQQNERELERLETEQNTKSSLLKSYITSLPTSFYLQIVGSTSKEINLEEISYLPTESLSEIELSIKNRKKYENELIQLQKDREKILQDEAKKQQIENLLLSQQSNLDIAELEKAREQQPILLTQHQELELKIKEQKQICQQTQQSLNKLTTEINTLSSALQQSQQTQAVETQVKKEIENNCQELINAIPESWKLQANQISDTSLKNLENEYSSLTIYAEEYANLQKLEPIIPKLKKEIAKLEKQIREIPIEARKPANELLPTLDSYKKTRKEIEEEQINANAELRTNKQNLKQWMNLRSKKREADDNLATYKMLADFLGRNGLQMHLLREAEKSIVDYANEVLDSLSRGKLRLTLQGTYGSNLSESSKALDLVVCNYEIGSQPMSVSFASGSQRFRIAVSLALAIGRYVGQHAGRIKSVIIDEGFGSLDKNGREDMIQELSILQQQLAKIILVSHQEDFTNAFTNGYTIKLETGTSQVQLFEIN